MGIPLVLTPDPSVSQKQAWMTAQLTESWASADVWQIWKVEAFRDHFQSTPQKALSGICSTYFERCTSGSLKTELKYACYHLVTSNRWHPRTAVRQGTRLNRLIEWLNEDQPKVVSFISKPLTAWVTSLESFLKRRQIFKQYRQSRIGVDDPIVFQAPDPRISLLRQIYKVLADLYDPRSEYDQDRWDLRRYYESSGHWRQSVIDFSKIHQPWLYETAKRFIKYGISTGLAAGTCCARLQSLVCFSRFLHNRYPVLQPVQLNRLVVLDFMGELASHGTRKPLEVLCHLKQFLETSQREHWLPLPGNSLIIDEDLPKPPKPLPRYIPERVLQQLEQHVTQLPSMYFRMALVLRETGRRISEICTLKTDCLRQDAAGDWWLFYYQHKMKKEHSIPLWDPAVVTAIQTQRSIVLEERGPECSYLFPSSRYLNQHLPVKGETFIRKLRWLAHTFDIRDETGRIWHFQTHQFRHTVATKMINTGVPQHIVQQFLGHESPEMTSRYAFIHDRTLKQEFRKIQKTIVDVTGKAVSPYQIVAELAQGQEGNDVDAQWLKRNILAQALPNGLCALPVIQGKCPYGANKCLSCVHFRTDERYLDHHQEHLERTSRLVAWASEQPENRRAQEILKENLPIKDNLERIITTLEATKHDSSS